MKTFLINWLIVVFVATLCWIWIVFLGAIADAWRQRHKQPPLTPEELQRIASLPPRIPRERPPLEPTFFDNVRRG